MRPHPLLRAGRRIRLDHPFSGAAGAAVGPGRATGAPVRNVLIQAAKYIGAGLAVSAISGAGTGIGSIFSALLTGVAHNPDQKEQLFSYAILGFALTEAIALFGLMMSFLILFA